MVPTDDSAAEKVRAARAKAVYLRWYFRHALYALVPRESREVPTLGVDKWGRLYFNPEFVHSVSIDELAAVLLHEVAHKLRRHHERAEALGVTHATFAQANIAQDCEINDDLREEIRTIRDLPELPGQPWYPEAIGCKEGEVWEVYYAHIMDNPEKLSEKVSQQSAGGGMQQTDQATQRQDGEGGDGQGGNGQKGRQKGSGGGSEQKGGGKSEQSGGKSEQSGGGPSEGRKGWNGRHQCGSAAHGVAMPWEDKAPSSGGGEGTEEGDWRDIEKRVATEIKEQAAKGRGKVPGSWVEWADAVLKPVRIPWEQELAGTMRRAMNDVAGKMFHSYSRPSRRASAMPNIIMPSMRRPVPIIAIVADTSGSMNENDLALVRGTVTDIAQAMGATVALIATDAQVHGGVQRVQDGRRAVLAGRGGTDMRVGVEHALTEVRPRPDVIVVITDAFTPWPEEEPPARVVVAAIRSDACSDSMFSDAINAVPSWAKTVIVHKDSE